MNTTRKAVITGVVVAIIAAIPLSLQHQRIRQLEENGSEPEARRSSSERSTAQGSGAEESVGQPNASSRARGRRRQFSSSEEELSALRDTLADREAELELVTRPFTTEASSSFVKVELGADEVLVMGGFKMADGRYQFTFLAPQEIDSKAENGALQVKAQVLILPEEAVETAGLDTLATNARNTLQHAEAWPASDLAVVMRQAAGIKGGEYMVAPMINVNADQKFELSLGDESAGYSLGGTLGRGGEGFDVSARIEIREQPE